MKLLRFRGFKRILQRSGNLAIAFLLLLTTISWLKLMSSSKSTPKPSFGNIIKWSPDSFVFNQPLNDRIYMHETTGKGYLSLRQTCVVESSAKHNPSTPIQIFMKDPLLPLLNKDIDGSPWLRIFSYYSNVVIVLINETEYFEGTKLENWYKEGKWRKSKHWIEHLSDYIRMVSLWRNGGLYMDLDIIIKKPIDLIIYNNFFLCEDHYCDIVNNGMFHFNHRHRIIDKVLEYLASGYNSTTFAAQGPDLVTRLMVNECEFRPGFPLTNQCTDVALLPFTFVYPLLFDNLNLISKNFTQPILSWLQPSYGVHIWNKYSRFTRLDVKSNSLFSFLASANCPLTVQYENLFFD